MRYYQVLVCASLHAKPAWSASESAQVVGADVPAEARARLHRWSRLTSPMIRQLLSNLGAFVNIII